jgi:hypothetical protein
LFIIWNSLILFQTNYFPTLDGGAHAYNAKIMASLLFGNDPFYSNFYQMNPEPVPNWLTSGLSMVLNTLMSPSASEKTILLLYFISFPLLFRLVADRLSEKKSYLIFLVFPLTHYALLYYGFFNFSYGILFFLLGISYWLKHAENLKLKKLLLFTLICLLTYFSHLFAFMALLIFLAVNELYFFIGCIWLNEDRKSFKEQFKISLFRALKLLPCVLVPLLFSLLYFTSRPELSTVFLEPAALNKLLTEGSIFKSFNTSENYTAAFFFYLFTILVVYAFITKLKTAIENKGVRGFFSKNDVFFFCSLIMLWLFYTRPDSDGYGAFISLRFALYTFILAALWLAGRSLDKVVELLATASLVVCMFFFVNIKKESVRWLNSELKKLDPIAGHIREGSIVAPLHFAEYNWLGAHYSNYLAARKKIIVTENFEASTGYFPVTWKSHEMPLYLLSPPPIDEYDCVAFTEELKNYSFGHVDYVFVYGEKTNVAYYNVLIKEIKQYYKLIYSFENVFLYERDPERSNLTPEQLRAKVIKDAEAEIRKNPEWMKQIEKKAKEQGVAVDEMVTRDAVYMIDLEKNEQK